jgi:hypothetical protein
MVLVVLLFPALAMVETVKYGIWCFERVLHIRNLLTFPLRGRSQGGCSDMQRIIQIIGKSAVYVGIIAGLIIFGIWMNIVGNPHVAETSIGVLIGIGVGILVWYKLRKLRKE